MTSTARWSCVGATSSTAIRRQRGFEINRALAVDGDIPGVRVNGTTGRDRARRIAVDIHSGDIDVTTGCANGGVDIDVTGARRKLIGVQVDVGLAVGRDGRVDGDVAVGFEGERVGR